MRFDVVGVGVTALHIINVSGGLTNPSTVAHTTTDGAFDSETVYDAGHTLHWSASFSETTPVTPGGSNTFAATASCSGCTLPLTYSWQFDSSNTGVFTSEASGNPVTVTLPSTFTGYRVDLQISDSAATPNIVHLVQHIPLTTVMKDTTSPSNSFATNVAQTFARFWLGGVPPYTGSLRFCPGIGNNNICSVAAAAIASTTTQTASSPVTYKLQGVYTDSLSITDSNPGFAGGATTSKFLLVVNATGGTGVAAYVISITANSTSISVGKGVLFTAVATYAGGATGFPAASRGTSISLNFRFGDGTTGTATIAMTTGGANSTTISHQYITASSPTFSAFAVGTDNTISLIQETSNRIAITVGGAAADFSVTASPTSATSTITVSAINGFTGTVALTDTVPANLSCGAITPASVTNSGTATVACSSTVAGTYTLTITGTSGTLSHSTTATFTVRDFSVSATSPPAVTASRSATSTITITALNGFTGTVTLTDAVPTGLTCGAITPSSVTNSGTATVSCSSTVAATYTLTITGTSGTLSHSTTATFTVTDFSITATSPAAVNAGTSATSTITVTAINGFTGTVSLTDTIPTNLTCGAISPASITNSGTATVSCSSTVAATYTLTITGTSGTLSHSTTATFTVRD